MSDIKLYAQFIAEQSQKTHLTDKLEAVKNMKESNDLDSIHHPISKNEIGILEKTKTGWKGTHYPSGKSFEVNGHKASENAAGMVIAHHDRWVKQTKAKGPSHAEKTTNEAAYTPNTTRMIDPQPDKEKMAAQAAKSPEQRRKEAKASVRQGLQNTVNQAKEKGRFAFTKKARSALRYRVNMALNAARSRNVSANQVK